MVTSQVSAGAPVGGQMMARAAPASRAHGRGECRPQRGPVDRIEIIRERHVVGWRRGHVATAWQAAYLS
jgi:hypothetical protein